MTKEKLEQLTNLRAEIKQLQREIETIKEQKAYVVKDKVQGSSKEWPYTLGNKVIVGIDVKEENVRELRIIKRSELLARRLQSAEELELEITAFINSIPDSTTRRIFSLRYEQGKTWCEIGKNMGMDHSTVMRKCEKYLNLSQK